MKLTNSLSFSRIRRVLPAALLALTLLAPGTAAAEPAQLIVHEGVVVKFGPGAGLKVRDALRSAPGVVFTSQADDSAGGQTLPQAGTPAPGDWQGLLLEPAARPDAVVIDGAHIRYAGGGNAAALGFGMHDYRFDSLSIVDSVVGIRATQGGKARLNGLRLLRNGIAVQAGEGAIPSLAGSEIAQNADYGAQNLSPANVIDARGNWWGDASGPLDAANNPAGRGDRVSAGIDYGQFRTTAPLAACGVRPANGYIAHSRTVGLLLTCPHAAEYRLSENNTFADAVFAPLASPVDFTLSAGAGNKTVYAQFKAANGETVVVALPQPLAYAPLGPVVDIVTPPENATLSANTTVGATASDPAGIARIDFYIDDQLIGSAAQAPYQTLWLLGATADGSHTLKAVATSTQQLTGEARRTVTVAKGGGDFTGPDIALQFNGAALIDGATLTQTGLLALAASDPSGIVSASVGFDSGPAIVNLNFGGAASIARYVPLTFDGLAAGAHTLVVAAKDRQDNESTRRINFTLALAAPLAPRIATPASGSTVSRSPLPVTAHAPLGARVQFHLDGSPVGGLLDVNAAGSVSASLPLGNEGRHELTADARDARGTSPRSSPVRIDYSAPAPSVAFINPAPGAVLTASPTLEILATDDSGIVRVDLSVDGAPLASLTQPPWRILWDIANVADGSHALKASATNTLGKTSETRRDIAVQKTAVPPPPLPPVYRGEIVSVAPALSYGTQTVLIAGRALDRDSGQPVPNAALRLRLKAGSLLRTIDLNVDSAGAFAYTFIPRDSDAGTYLLHAAHPEESAATFSEQGRFTLDRVRFNVDSVTLNAARGIPSLIPLTATASSASGVSGLRWVALPADQPGGSLPAGIVIDGSGDSGNSGGSGIDLAPGASAPMSIRFTAGANAAESGSVFLTALANGSGSAPRGRLRIDYRLTDARPALFASPTYLETGVQQGKSVNAAFTLGNRGLAAARNVRLELRDKDGNPPPAWVFLASGRDIGHLDVGASIALQITASPGNDIADGLHLFKLIVSADNDSGGSIPVSIAVTRSGQGGIRFEVADIYTNTLDKTGQTIPGLAGATLKLQHDTIPAIANTLTSNAQGIASIDGLAPGVYRYRASAPKHYDVAGRILVRPGVTHKESVFLDYKLINIEFGVSETTIKDSYHITVNATFNAEVPAPVVLLEPLAINLPEMQVGEELSGELTLTNYGLVEAQGVAFTPPASDEFYRYEFSGTVPATLPAKTRIVIPYKVTSIKARPKLLAYVGSNGTSRNPEFARLQAGVAQAKSASCSSYSSSASVSCYWTCANGTTSKSSAGATFSTMSGRYCANGIRDNVGDPSPGGVGVNPSTPTATPLTTCTPQCHGPCCVPGGAGGGNGTSGNSSGGGGFGSGGASSSGPGVSYSQY